MATWQCWWRTSAFPVSDQDAFAECFAALGLDGEISKQPDGQLIVGTTGEGIDAVPDFEEPELDAGAVEVFERYGLEAPEAANVFSVIAHFLPDAKTKVSLTSLAKVKMADLEAEAWIWTRDKGPAYLNLWSGLLDRAAEQGITS